MGYEKARVTIEIVGAVFFDMRQAYDMMWREGLLIKLQLIGIEGNIFNRGIVWDFFLAKGPCGEDRGRIDHPTERGYKD